MYSLQFLRPEVKNQCPGPKSRCWQGHAPSRSSGGQSASSLHQFLSFSVAAGIPRFYWPCHFHFQGQHLWSLSTPSCHYLQCVCPFLKRPVWFYLVQFSSVTQLCPTLLDPKNRSTPSLPVHHQLLELTQTHVHWVGDVIQPSRPLSSPSPPAFSLSQHQSLFQESALHIRQPKYWSFNFSIIPSNEHPGLISFGVNWLDLLAVQETLKSFLQHHSSKASILWHSTFFVVQLSHPYMTTGKTTA